MGIPSNAASRYGPPRRGSGLPGALLAGCALSAGVHAGLAPAHLAEAPSVGIGFLISAALLSALGLGVFVWPRSGSLSLAVALSCVALIAGYVASRTIGLPFLHPEREAVDAVGVITTAVELGTLAAALHLFTQARRWHSPLPDRRSTTWIPISSVQRTGS